MSIVPCHDLAGVLSTSWMETSRKSYLEITDSGLSADPEYFWAPK